MAVDWFSLIEPRRVAEVSLTPGGLEGDVGDQLDSPPPEGEEESWLQAHLRRLKELVGKAGGAMEKAKGNGKRRLAAALGNIRESARKAKQKVLELLPDSKDLKDGFEGIVKLSTKLLWAEKALEAVALAALIWAADRYFS